MLATPRAVMGHMNSRIFKNTTSYMLAGMLPNFVSLFMIPIYTRYLEPDDYGVVSLVTAFTNFLLVVMGLQMGNSLERLYFDYKDQRLKEFFSSVLYGILIINLALIIPLHIFGEPFAHLIFPQDNVPYRPYILLGLVVIFFRSFINYFNMMLRVQERGLNLLVNAVINVILGIGFGLYFIVYRNMGAYGVMLSQVYAAVVHFVILLVILIGHIRPVFKPALLKPALSYSLPLIPHALGGILFISSDRFILGYFVSLGAIGLYDLADKIAMVIKVFISSFNSATMPTFIRHTKTDRAQARVFYRDLMTRWCVIIAAIFLAMSLFAEELIWWLLPEKYYGAHVFVPILVGAYVFRGLYGFPINSVMYEKKTFTFPLITFTAGVMNIAGNILLIPLIGVIAAAWTTLLSYALTFVLALYFSNRYYPLEYEWGKILSIFGVALALFSVELVLPIESHVIMFLIKLAAMAMYILFIWKTDLGNFASDGIRAWSWFRSIAGGRRSTSEKASGSDQHGG